MAILIKCYADDVVGNTASFKNKKPAVKPMPESGDRVFIWTFEMLHKKDRGAGLAERALLTSFTPQAEDSRTHISFTPVSSGPFSALKNAEVEYLRTNYHSLLEKNLASKLRDAGQGIYPLDDDEADYLDDLYEPVVRDLEAIRRDESVDVTMRERLIDARLGQGRFREQVLSRWGACCVVTDCSLLDVLRASHIKPWRSCDNAERLNPANGLLLTANLDALFDRNRISFDDQGQMLVPPAIEQPERERLGIPQNLRAGINLGEALPFLAHHRLVYFERNGL